MSTTLDKIDENESNKLYSDDDVTLIDWNKITDSLKKINIEGIISTMILNKNGNLLASSNIYNKNYDKEIIPSILSVIWNNCTKIGSNFIDAQDLEFIFLSHIKGLIVLTTLSLKNEYFLCLIANKNINLGFLKLKTQLIADQMAKKILIINDYHSITSNDDDDSQSNNNNE